MRARPGRDASRREPGRLVEAGERAPRDIHVGDEREDMLAYVRSGLSNGRTEGLNGKARTITRRAFGFHNPDGLIALLELGCSGVHLDPVHYWPGSTH